MGSVMSAQDRDVMASIFYRKGSTGFKNREIVMTDNLGGSMKLLVLL